MNKSVYARYNSLELLQSIHKLKSKSKLSKTHLMTTIDNSQMSQCSIREKIYTQTSLSVRDEIESKFNILITPRESEAPFNQNQEMRILQPIDDSIQIQSIKNRFGEITFDEMISSNCTNCYKIQQKTKIPNKKPKEKRGKLFYFDFI